MTNATQKTLIFHESLMHDHLKRLTCIIKKQVSVVLFLLLCSCGACESTKEREKAHAVQRVII